MIEVILNLPPHVSPSWWGHAPGLLAVEADLARSRSPPRNLGCRLQVKTWYDRARLELIVTVLSAVDLASRTGGQHRYERSEMQQTVQWLSIFPGTHTLNSISCQTEGDLIESDLLLSNRENIFSERSKRRTKTLANTNNPRYIYISFANFCPVLSFFFVEDGIKVSCMLLSSQANWDQESWRFVFSIPLWWRLLSLCH